MLSRLFRFISRIALPQAVVVGFDVQDRHLFGVATVHARGVTKVVATGTYELPDEEIEDGELRRSEAVEAGIRALLAQIPVSRWHTSHEPICVISLPPQHLYSEAVFFPDIDEGDIAEAIRLKIETSLPWPLSDAYLDWKRVEAGRGEGAFIAATSKTTLDQYLRIFLVNRLRVAAVEFHLFSLVRFIDKSANSFVFILIDEDGIEYAVFAYGTIVAHYIQAAVSREEQQKNIEGKVRQLTSYLESQYGVKVERIYLFDKINLGETSSSLTDITGIPAQLFTPEHTLDPRLSVAYGASLRPYATDEALINLLPPAMGGRYEENLLMKTLRFWTKIVVICSMLFIVAFGMFYLYLTGERKAIERENIALKAHFDELVTLNEPLIQRATYFNSLAASVGEGEANRSYYGEKLDVVVGYLGESGSVLTYLRADGGNRYTMRMVAPTRDAAVAFQNQLNASGLLQGELQIPITQLGGEKDLPIAVTFEL